MARNKLAAHTGRLCWLWLRIIALLGAAVAAQGATNLPSLEEVIAARQDLWGEAAMREPNGASYEFFERLLPPPRYVNADFRYYPIVLSAPNAPVKARLISNGSGINLSAGARSWRDNGTPVTFRVGPDEFLFGGLRDRLSEPTLAEGWLPIAEIRYRHPSPLHSEGAVPLNQQKIALPPEIYRLEAFASTDSTLAEAGVVFVKFSLVQGTNGYVAVEVDAPSPTKFAGGRLLDERGRVLALLDKSWKRERGLFVTRLMADSVVVLAIPTKPLDAASALEVTLAEYDKQRAACAETWRKLVDQGMNVEVPEPVVNHAWRNSICQNFALINGDRIHYSAGNQYDKLYEAEGSDAALALMVWGHEADMRRLMAPLFDFTREGLEFHQAGFKLNNLCRYYWQTRDPTAMNDFRPRWEKEAERLDKSRTGPHGLYPKERYCGDISTPVQSLNVSAKAWRAMRDLAAVLAEVGETAAAKHYADQAAAFRKTVLEAINQSVRRDTDPPFVPIALYGDEPAYDPICRVRIGSYWNIIIGYTVGSGIFLPGSAEETWIPRYQEGRGGLCMGMLRSGGGVFNFWTGEDRVNPLYGARSGIDRLRRDDVERALTSFYGMLAQGLTRNTFIGGEGCTLAPVDDGGRMFYCPPNSAASAYLLTMLRYQLVQDWDLDDDGKPETLRLAFATPKRWLEDGKTIKVERAPTAFGPVSMKLESRLAEGKVLAEVDLPERNPPQKTLLRTRLPEGWEVAGVRGSSGRLTADKSGAVDLSALKGKVSLVFMARKK
jgi:hypothetical protein